MGRSAGRLDGRVAVVTGGASGMGRHFSLELAREGAQVAAFDMNAEGLASLAASEGNRAWSPPALGERSGSASGMSCRPATTTELASTPPAHGGALAEASRTEVTRQESALATDIRTSTAVLPPVGVTCTHLAASLTSPPTSCGATGR